MICPHCNFDNYAGEEVCERCLLDLTQVDSAPKPKNEFHRTIIEEPVSKLDLPPLLVCKAEDQVADVIEVMKSKKLGCVVVQEKQFPLGIFTERDIVMKVVSRAADPKKLTVRGIMTSPVETVKSSDSIAFALNKMSIGGYRHVPIVDEEGRVTGVISVRNILQYLAKQIG